MNILSTFDGISCGQIALRNLGFRRYQYFSSEIDKNAIKVTQHRFPKTIQLGDIQNVHSKDLPKIDLLLGGSPCQGFSSAGKGLNFSDPRSKLFFEFLRLKKTLNAKYFLLENVKMKKEWENIITNLMGVEPIRINSADFSAQNRIRLYWTNIPFNPFIKKDQSVIRDVIPTVLKNKYIIHPRRKVIVLPHKKSRKTVGYIGTPAQACKIYSIDEKGVTLCATGGGLGGKTGLYAIPLSLIEIYSKDPKIFTFYAYKSRECCVIAKPPPDMCEKLQTIPLDYTAGLSDNQRYLLIGNGWTIKVIEHLLKPLKKEFNRSLMK